MNNLTERRHRFKQIIAAARPRISTLIRNIIDHDSGDNAATNLVSAELARWRTLAGSRAGSDAGYTYAGYVQLRVMSALDSLAVILTEIGRRGYDTYERHTLAQILEQWAQSQNLASNPTFDSESDSCAPFLDHYDAHFRVRRLRFVIRRLNELYQAPSAYAASNASSDVLSEFKTALYETLDKLLQRLNGDFYSTELRNHVFSLFNQLNVASSAETLTEVLTALRDEMTMKTAG